MAVRQRSRAVDRSTTHMQKAALAVGVVFAVVGIAGFIPGITSDLGDIEWVGPDSGAELLGVFQVSVLHNLVHLLFGALGVYAARSFTASRLYLIGGGIVYALLVIYGALVDKDSDANFVPLDRADDWLHVVLATAMIALGVILGREAARRAPGANDRASRVLR